eukprot:tig00000480_g1290.t1
MLLTPPPHIVGDDDGADDPVKEMNRVILSLTKYIDVSRRSFPRSGGIRQVAESEFRPTTTSIDTDGYLQDLVE